MHDKSNIYINIKGDDQELVVAKRILKRAFGWCEKVGYERYEFILRATHSKAYAL